MESLVVGCYIRPSREITGHILPSFQTIEKIKEISVIIFQILIRLVFFFGLLVNAQVNLLKGNG
jgi:hypothetical protein